MKILLGLWEVREIGDVFADRVSYTVVVRVCVCVDNIEIPEDKVQPTLQTMKEYMEFVESVENDRVARKIEAQLGRKVLILRMALSIENFSVHFAPVAGDRMLVKDRISKTE